MATYDIEFSETLITAGRSIEVAGLDSLNAKRTVLYMSLLSVEISLKSFLETAGVPVPKIKSRSHNLDQLMNDACCCEVEVDLGDGKMYWVSAAQLRSIPTREGDAESTLGAMLSDDQKSKYPNDIRYGEKITHYSPSTMLKAAGKLAKKIKGYGNRVRIKSGAIIN